MKKVSLLLCCLLGVGCTDENVKIVEKTPWGEAKTPLGDLLNHRPICQKVTWEPEVTESAIKVKYTCKLDHYDNQLLRIVNQDMIQHEKNDANMLRKYKEDIEISEFRLDQLQRLEKALIELNENGIADLYKSASNTLHMNNIDYSYIFKGPIEPIAPVDGYDDTAQRNLYTALKIIQETFLRHGLVKESFAHIGLSRAKLKNIDYLKITEEEKQQWFTYDRNTITQRKMNTIETVNALERTLSDKIEFFHIINSLKPVKELNQTMIFQIVDNMAVPIQCEFNAITFKGDDLVLDDYKRCLDMAQAGEYDTDYLNLFQTLYQKIANDELKEQDTP